MKPVQYKYIYIFVCDNSDLQTASLLPLLYTSGKLAIAGEGVMLDICALCFVNIENKYDSPKCTY